MGQMGVRPIAAIECVRHALEGQIDDGDDLG